MEGMWSLIFFTLLVQASSGMVLWKSLLGGAHGSKAAPLCSSQQKHLCATNKLLQAPCWTYAALGLALLGTFFSLLHLSAPSHSIFTINNIFSSWLSREIASVGLFVALLCAYIYTGCSLMLYGSGIASLLLSYSMSKIYTVSLVPYWQHICVFGYFLSSALVLGGMLLLLGAFFNPTKSTKENINTTMKSPIPVALALALALRIGFGIEQAIQHIPAMSSFALHAAPVLLAFALVLLLLLQRQPLCAGHDTHKAHACMGLYTIYALTLAIFVLGGELLGRITFYQGYTWFGM